jgi:SHS2 domain-containing protein
MSAGGRFRFVEGATSDLSFEADGASIADVFHAAAEALAAATVEHPEEVRPSAQRSIHLEDGNLELLLLRFLNELVYLRDAEGLVLRAQRVRCETGPPIRLDAQLAGEMLAPARHGVGCEVKAATAHGLAFLPTADGWKAYVTLDV